MSSRTTKLMRIVALAVTVLVAFTVHLMAEEGTHPPAFNVGYRVYDFPCKEAKAGSITVAVWYPTAAEPSGFEYPVRETEGCVAVDAPVDAEHGPYPLVIYSHGYGGSGIAAVFFTEYLAARGFIAVAPDYEDKDKAATVRGGRNIDLLQYFRNAIQLAKSGKDFDRAAYAYRPKSLSFVLDKMLEMSSSKDSGFCGTIDGQKIGAVGHSLGAYTTLAAIGLDTENADGRIKAAVMHSGGVFMFEAEEYKRVKVPVMFIFGELEERGRERLRINDIRSDTFRAYDNCQPPKFVFELKQATHFSFCQLVYRTLPARMNPGLAEKQVRFINTRTTAFLQRYLNGDKSAGAILTKEDPMVISCKYALGDKAPIEKQREAPRPPKTELPNVTVIKDVAYYDGPDADEKKHTLDLYLPVERKNFPVLIFIHGGAWKIGDKDSAGPLYENVGAAFAEEGVGTVVINYRLSPDVTHPEHIRDCARAFAWTYKRISEYGGDPNSVFVSGQSAGGHLAALLATNERYLREQGLSKENIAGVIPISGVYVVRRDLFGAFGNDSEHQRDASPLDHVGNGLPPFLIIYAERDPLAIRLMSKALAERLSATDNTSQLLEIPGRNHISIIVCIGSEGDPTTAAILRFIGERSSASASKTRTASS